MRPTTGTMLQQNNNNNYPCLNVSGSTREMLQKSSLPFPGRMELGLGDLPLIRGLRAWALCSKNRRKAGGLLGGGQAPTAPPASRGGSTSCPRPADVYLSGEWGRLGYGLPLGLDGGQAGIGALVTVATLKTSEGCGKTQTQCLFLRTEKGSCLYSTAKPGSGVASSAASGVGGWLRGKTSSGGSRDNGPAPGIQTGANRVRVRSGRRWRKSCNAAGREKAGASRERRGEDHAEIILEERQEEGDKGGLVCEQFPSPQKDDKKACRSPRCCHDHSPKTCSQCRKERESQDENEVGESPSGGVQNSEVKGMKKERQKNEEELELHNSVLAAPNLDLQSKHLNPESHSSWDVEEIGKAESNEKISHIEDKCLEKKEGTDSEEIKVQTGSNNLSHGRSGRATDDISSPVKGVIDQSKQEEIAADVNRSPDCQHESGAEIVKMKINPTSADFLVESECPEDVLTCSESSSPAGGSTCEKESSKYDQTEGSRGADPGIDGEENVDVCRIEQHCANTVIKDPKPALSCKNVEKSSKNEEEASLSTLRLHSPSIFYTDGKIKPDNGGIYGSDGAKSEDEMVFGEEEPQEERVDLEKKEETVEIISSVDSFDATETEVGANKSSRNEEVIRDCAPKHTRRSAGGCRGGEIEAGGNGGHASITHADLNLETSSNVTNAPSADLSTSITPSPANPAPSLPPLGSMATGLPCLEAEKAEEVEVQDGEGGQEGARRHGRELEEPGKEERGSTVATEEGTREEEEEEEDDEFGVFMQAEGEPAWSEGSSMSASVPCGSRGSVVLGNSGESTHWTPGWTENSSPQLDDSWTAFPQDSADSSRDTVGQWWPTSAVEQSRDKLLANQNLASVFAEAFPSLPASSSSDLDAVPTLTQILRGRADQHQGLLDSFHDLNKMICQRYKRANGVSRDLLLKTLHLEPPPHAEVRPAPRTANRRLSPGLPSANQHAQNAAAKRRLSYDYNRNIKE